MAHNTTDAVSDSIERTDVVRRTAMDLAGRAELSSAYFNVDNIMALAELKCLLQACLVNEDNTLASLNRHRQ